jgi:hypothetical protein
MGSSLSAQIRPRETTNYSDGEKLFLGTISRWLYGFEENEKKLTLRAGARS